MQRDLTTRLFLAFGGALLLLLAGCATSLEDQGRWQSLDTLDVSGKTRDGAPVSVFTFSQPHAVEHILAKLEQDHPHADQEERILNILAYVQAIPIANDPDDLWLTPGETLIAGGDCEDRSFLLSSLLGAAQIEHWVVVGTFRDRPHTWVAVQDPAGKLRYLETLDKNPRLTAPTPAYAPWGRWNPLTREIHEWIPNPNNTLPPEEEPFPPTKSEF
ncbi:MAG: hypothetical protein QM518_14390 [Verrucomicrobiota bacterium]|nr:hypothetical protein [Verrucomicrobiota bacterium]